MNEKQKENIDVNSEEYKEALQVHQDSIGELWGANKDCWHELDPKSYSGIKCLKCGGWFCY